MLKELTKLATTLDSRGLRKQADILDSLIKAAIELGDDPELEISTEDSTLTGGDEESEEKAGGESSSSIKLRWVDRGEWLTAQSDLRKSEVFTGNMEAIDMDAMRIALENEPGDEEFYVMDPFSSEFERYIQAHQPHEDGKSIAVPLNTYTPEKGKRINFFKINDWHSPVSGDRFGRVDETQED